MRSNQSIKLVDLIGSSEIATLDGMERMRAATVCAMAISIPLMAAGAWAQNSATVSERLGALAQRANLGACPGNPDSLGVARVVEIDTTGGPGFGFEHFKAYDFLRDGEVVLTFDDGPWPGNYASRTQGAGGTMHQSCVLPY